jgi:hypothetical protein
MHLASQFRFACQIFLSITKFIIVINFLTYFYTRLWNNFFEKYFLQNFNELETQFKKAEKMENQFSKKRPVCPRPVL